ncbi:MAG: hypothetical protein LBG43_06340 [Treponema sp.]|jgi:hypothetical protein|nr:hypothetical protein [Treponema sp.]
MRRRRFEAAITAAIKDMVPHYEALERHVEAGVYSGADDHAGDYTRLLRSWTARRRLTQPRARRCRARYYALEGLRNPEP